MRILFVADGRSPTALSWIEYFAKNKQHEVHLVSTFASETQLELASMHVVPVAFSGASKSSSSGRGLRAGLPASWRTALRNWAGPFTLSSAAQRLEALVAEIRPDLVHAMRIPYEGMLAAVASPSAPLLVSVWGNDFTLHARSNPFMAAATRRTLQRASAVHTDTQRDQRLARDWGFDASKPNLVAPGNGGVRSEVFHPANKPAGEPRVINPRGIRAYVRNDSFFRSIPLILEQKPDVFFDCPAMQGEPEAERLVRALGIEAHVRLLPKLGAVELAEAYRGAQVMVSPSTHDGTPNSLLEAMACGVFPVCGDIESIHEWIRDGETGLLVDPANPQALADATMLALNDGALRAKAAVTNSRLVAERADRSQTMKRIEAFYEALI